MFPLYSNGSNPGHLHYGGGHGAGFLNRGVYRGLFDAFALLECATAGMQNRLGISGGGLRAF